MDETPVFVEGNIDKFFDSGEIQSGRKSIEFVTIRPPFIFISPNSRNSLIKKWVRELFSMTGTRGDSALFNLGKNEFFSRGVFLANDALPFLEPLKDLLHVEVGRQTSACLFGSAVTDEWIAARSDLDILVIVPEKKLGLFGQKLKDWQRRTAHPALDGYVLHSSGNATMVRELHQFEKVSRPVGNFIPLIDLWNAKNRSRHLFGNDLRTLIPEISQEELRVWAIRDIECHWIPLLADLVSMADKSTETKIQLTPLVWVASGVARMLMLARGKVCASKREALQWLAEENSEIRETINLLIENFEKPDCVAPTFASKHTHALGKFYLRLLELEVQK